MWKARTAMNSRFASIAVLVAVLAVGASAEDVLHLADGSRVVGIVAEETAGAVELRTRYGTLSIPVADIRGREMVDDGSAPVDERWILAPPPAQARLVRSIAIPAGAESPFVLPVEGRVVAVRDAKGAALASTSMPVGTLTLLSVELGEHAVDRIEVEAVVDNPLIACGDDCFAFTRTYTQEEAGTLRIAFEVPPGWTADAGTASGNGVVVEKSLRRQEPYALAVRFAASQE